MFMSYTKSPHDLQLQVNETLRFERIANQTPNFIYLKIVYKERNIIKFMLGNNFFFQKTL